MLARLSKSNPLFRLTNLIVAYLIHLKGQAKGLHNIVHESSIGCCTATALHDEGVHLIPPRSSCKSVRKEELMMTADELE